LTTIAPISPPLPLVTPKGPADAYWIVDNGIDRAMQFVTFVRATGECWVWNQRDVRLEPNVTEGRAAVSPFE
jgi:hypothetical protein